MKVVFLTDVVGHGKKGEVADVNEGYARNFLIPKKKAVEATSSALNEIAQKAAAQAKKDEIEQGEARELAEALSNIVLEIKVKSGEGKIFGSVTTKEIAEELKVKGFKVDKKQIVMKEVIKRLGHFEVDVKLNFGISTKIKINVIKE